MDKNGASLAGNSGSSIPIRFYNNVIKAIIPPKFFVGAGTRQGNGAVITRWAGVITPTHIAGNCFCRKGEAMASKTVRSEIDRHRAKQCARRAAVTFALAGYYPRSADRAGQGQRSHSNKSEMLLADPCEKMGNHALDPLKLCEQGSKTCHVS